MRGGVALIVAAGLAAVGCAGDEPASEPAPPRSFPGAPRALAAVHRQAGDLVPGGRDAYDRRLAALRGHPVVVNKWASWCAPCRGEFPVFQRVAARLARRVGFLGVNSNDNDDAARRFLARYPVPYPSFADGDSAIAGMLGFAQAFPVTAFYDRRGERVYTHPGPYRSDADLLADVRRYSR